MIGLILYGPPAAGKDTITEALGELDHKYVLFPRLKVGAGRTAGYRMTTAGVIDELRASGEVVWENRRYDAVYVVDRPELTRRLREHVPVLHLGQVEAIRPVVNAVSGAAWLVVYVWCRRETAARRIEARGGGDLDARLRAWDETRPLPDARLTFDTGEVAAEDAARAIDDAVSRLLAEEVG